MKERQDVADAVVVPHVQGLDARRDKRVDVAMRQHHPFRHVGRAAGVDDDGSVIGLDAGGIRRRVVPGPDSQT